MILRLIRALFGRHPDGPDKSKHCVAMHAMRLKVDALSAGADRMEKERKRTEAAAAALLSRLREDLEK